MGKKQTYKNKLIFEKKNHLSMWKLTLGYGRYYITANPTPIPSNLVK
jgi:hypothetical protein